MYMRSNENFFRPINHYKQALQSSDKITRLSSRAEFFLSSFHNFDIIP
jgi:hypothetical protein